MSWFAIKDLADGSMVLTTDAAFDGAVANPGEPFMSFITLELGDLARLGDVISNHQLRRQLKGIGA